MGEAAHDKSCLLPLAPLICLAQRRRNRSLASTGVRVLRQLTWESRRSRSEEQATQRRQALGSGGPSKNSKSSNRQSVHFDLKRESRSSRLVPASPVRRQPSCRSPYSSLGRTTFSTASTSLLTPTPSRARATKGTCKRSYTMSRATLLHRSLEFP